MDEEYIVPRNVKRGRLILGKFHIRDLIILGIGIFVMLIGCVVSFNTFSGKAIIVSIVIFGTIGVTSILLTTPYNTYHNILGLIYEIADYITSNKDYLYEGKVYYVDEDF